MKPGSFASGIRNINTSTNDFIQPLQPEALSTVSFCFAIMYKTSTLQQGIPRNAKNRNYKRSEF